MVLIRALPEDYNSFVSSLLLKDNLDKAAVQIAFVREDNQRRRRQEESPAIGTALAASSPTSTTCTFCGSSGHSQDVCRQYARAKDQVGKNRNNRKKDLRLQKLCQNLLEMQVLPLHLHLPSLLILIGLQTQGRLLI